MTLTEAKRIAKTPASYTTEQLDDAMTVILDDDRLSETQVTNLLANIDREFRARMDANKATTYKAGTPISDVANFDRSTKAEFHCSVHPGSAWRSKEPSVSAWFAQPNNSSPFGDALHDCQIEHKCPGHYVLSADYPQPE